MIRSKKNMWRVSRVDHRGLCSKPIESGNKRFQNEINQWNMVQEWAKEVFSQINNLKHNID
jgi:hypothetical protein